MFEPILNLFHKVPHLDNIENGDFYFLLLLRIAFFALNFGANAAMWRFFVASLGEGSSVQASFVNHSLNFIFTAAYGTLLFNERITPQW